MEKTVDMPADAIRLSPLELNGVRFSGKHTVLTPGILKGMAEKK